MEPAQMLAEFGEVFIDRVVIACDELYLFLLGDLVSTFVRGSGIYHGLCCDVGGVLAAGLGRVRPGLWRGLRCWGRLGFRFRFRFRFRLGFWFRCWLGFWFRFRFWLG